MLPDYYLHILFCPSGQCYGEMVGGGGFPSSAFFARTFASSALKQAVEFRSTGFNAEVAKVCAEERRDKTHIALLFSWKDTFHLLCIVALAVKKSWVFRSDRSEPLVRVESGLKANAFFRVVPTQLEVF